MSVLRVERLRRNFGGLTAVHDVSLTVGRGEKRAIIGPNGAGKTTLFNVISGEMPPTSGRIFLGDKDITALPAHERANLGLGRTFQRNNLFFELTVFENVRLAVQHHHGITRHILAPAGRFDAVNDDTMQVLDRIGLAEQRDVVTRNLSYGEQRVLELALALATEPRILLMDEPTAGMSPGETRQMVELIRTLPHGLTVMVVEHDMDVVFALANRITVLHYGQVLADGLPDEVQGDHRVQEIYLGGV